MKAKLIEEKVFTLQVGEVSIAGLRQTSDWNGMSELCNDKGEKLIVAGLANDPFGRMLNDIFGTGKDREVQILHGSPALLTLLNASASAGVKEPS